jgi:hypothetical protein
MFAIPTRKNIKSADETVSMCVRMEPDQRQQERQGGRAYESLGLSCSISDCVLHRQAFVVKNMQTRLKDVLDDGVKTVSYIKSKSLYARLLKSLCDRIGKSNAVTRRSKVAAHGKRAYRSFWASFRNLCNLKSPITSAELFTKHHMVAEMYVYTWPTNELNHSLQTGNIATLITRDWISSFQRKLTFWTKSAERRNISVFQL